MPARLLIFLFALSCGSSEPFPIEECAMTPHVIRRFSGIVAGVNPFAVPEGACETADNCIIRSGELLEPRSGHASFASAAPINAMAFKEGKLVALTWDDSGRGVTGQLRYMNPVTGAFTGLPMNPGAFPFSQPGGDTAVRTRFMSAQKALYFQNRYGLTKVEDLVDGVSRVALQPANWTRSGSVTGVGTTASPTSATVNWLANGFQVAYRVTLARKGANSELIESEPSDRFVVSNDFGGARAVFLDFWPSYLIPPDTFVRIYRSVQVPNGTSPSDELYLVSEHLIAPSSDPLNPNGFDEVTYLFTYTDQTPDSQLYVPLYSNLQSGSARGKPFAPAPLSNDLTYFKNRAYAFNIEDVHRLALSIIGTGTGGIVDGDWISINGVRFTFRNTITNQSETQVFTAGTVVQNIENTARTLIARINEYFRTISYGGSPSYVQPPNVVLARYVSTRAADAGQIVLQRVVPGADAFTVQTSSRNGWSSDFTSPTDSDPSAQPAGVAWSEADQPEAWPLANRALVGDASDETLRGVTLKDMALIYQRRGGVWKITDDGTSSGPNITQHETTVRLFAPDTLVVLNDTAIGLCEDGVVAVADMGKVNLSKDTIQRELTRLMTYVGRDTMSKVAFAIANERDHQYILCLPESPVATSCSVQFVYNTETRSWCRWNLPGVIAGTVNPDTGELFWSFGSEVVVTAYKNAIWKQRRNGDSFDYQDPGFTIASPTNGAVATLVFAGDVRPGTATPIDVGDIIQQAQATYFVKQRTTAVSYSSSANQTTVTLDQAPTHPWSTGMPLTVVKAIKSVVKPLPVRADEAGGPTTDKKWDAAYLAFRFLDADFFRVAWESDKTGPIEGSIQVVSSDPEKAPVALSGWPPASWGSSLWGGKRTKNIIVKSELPSDCAYAAQLTPTFTFQNALTRWELAAFDPKIAGVTEKVARQ